MSLDKQGLCAEATGLWDFFLLFYFKLWVFCILVSE